MPAGRSQDSSMIYAVFIFVALFIASTAFAIVFYIKFQDYQKTALDAQKQLEAIAFGQEARSAAALVGKNEPKKSVLGSLLVRFDELLRMIIGNVPEELSAETKLELAKNKVSQIFAELPDMEPNSANLLRAFEVLKGQRDNIAAQFVAVNEKLNELSGLLDEDKKAAVEKEKELSSVIQQLQAEADKANKNYEELRAAMQKSTDQQVALIATQLEQAQKSLQDTQQALRAAEAKLKNSQDQVSMLRSQLEAIVPKPESGAAAFRADGQIISIDNSQNTVVIDLGSNDRVYRGLTFSVYDKNLPIPRDGKGKAAIEVFDVQKDVSVARITKAMKTNPIMNGDIVANLIWDSDTKREFVVIGEFVFGEGTATIKDLIAKWGGYVADSVSITTNFLVVGTAPVVPQKPSLEEIEADPRAIEKYDTAANRYAQYTQTLEQAKALSIPVFDLERFLDFIGMPQRVSMK